jgi:hypothetical protein
MLYLPKQFKENVMEETDVPKTEKVVLNVTTKTGVNLWLILWVMTFILAVLKITGYGTISWLGVFVPVLIPAGLVIGGIVAFLATVLVCFVVALVCGGIGVAWGHFFG